TARSLSGGSNLEGFEVCLFTNRAGCAIEHCRPSVHGGVMILRLRFLRGLGVSRFAVAVAALQRRLVFWCFTRCRRLRLFFAFLAALQGRALRTGVAIARGVERLRIRDRKQARFHLVELGSRDRVFVAIRESPEQIVDFGYAIRCRRMSSKQLRESAGLVLLFLFELLKK